MIGMVSVILSQSVVSLVTTDRWAYLRVGEAVSDDPHALVLPEAHQDVLAGDHVGLGVDHPLPDAGQVAQVEDVVELGRRGQHLDLRRVARDNE